MGVIQSWITFEVSNEERLEQQRRDAEARAEISEAQAGAIAARVEQERIRKCCVSIRQQLINKIDYFVRTRPNFDSRNPLSYLCSVKLIAIDLDVANCLNVFNIQYQRYLQYDTTEYDGEAASQINFVSFVRNLCSDEFVLHKSK